MLYFNFCFSFILKLNFELFSIPTLSFDFSLKLNIELISVPMLSFDFSFISI